MTDTPKQDVLGITRVITESGGRYVSRPVENPGASFVEDCQKTAGTVLNNLGGGTVSLECLKGAFDPAEGRVMHPTTEFQGECHLESGSKKPVCTAKPPAP